MKKLIFSLALSLAFSPLVHAQWTTNGTITSTTNSIGIGTTAPTEKLVVTGNIRSVLDPTNNPAKNVVTIKQLGFSGATGAQNWTLRGVYQYPNGVLGNADGGDLDIIKSLDGNTILGTKTDGTALGKVGIGITAPATQLHLAAAAGPVLTLDKTGVQAWRLDVSQNSDFRLWNASVDTAPLTVQALGNVGIGTTDPRGYKLAVNGSMIATSVTVKLAANWPDYVFKKDYQLPSLQEVKAYIDQNQHLPEIPSEQQIAKDGLNLGEMNKLLMKKVEELTLYLIQQKEENAKVKETQEKLLKTQQTQIDLLIRTVASLQKNSNNE
ncbi:hypothetical protein [Mucilaginibacter sp. 22184]|uniref:hypothetical protein n=1 Tax=Mucilaginibacter sp. 22184 TaxID=3453887 RepID=UPI003F872E37